MRRFFRPIFLRPLPVFFVPTQFSVMIKWIRFRTPLGAIAPSPREADQIGNPIGYQTHPPESKIRLGKVVGYG